MTVGIIQWTQDNVAQMLFWNVRNPVPWSVRMVGH